MVRMLSPADVIVSLSEVVTGSDASGFLPNRAVMNSIIPLALNLVINLLLYIF